MAVETRNMRKFLNDPSQVVKESLAGLAAAHSDLVRYDAAAQIIVRKDAPKRGKVALISGGGSGHEPLHGGFVGMGMLDAAAPGEVFTSPVPAQMLAATKAVDGGAGVVHIVKNYTGDVLNLKLAAAQLSARRAKSSTSWSRQWSRTSRRREDRRSSYSSTGWAARPSSSFTWSTARSTRSSGRPASSRCATWSAATSRRSRWRVHR